MLTYTVGKANTNDIILTSPEIADVQLAITQQNDGTCFIENLVPHLDLFINDTICNHTKLTQGDCIQLGGFSMLWYESLAATCKKLKSTLGYFRFIGRDERCEISLFTPTAALVQACIITQADGKNVIVDIGNSGTVFVNGVKVYSAELKPTDRLVVGNENIDFNNNSTTTNANKYKWLSLVGFVVLIAVLVGISEPLLQPSPFPFKRRITTKAAELPTPPAIELVPSKRTHFCAYQLELEELSEVHNYTNPICRNLALKLAAKSKGSYNLGQVCEIYDYVYQNWKFVNDPLAQELLSSASNTIRLNLSGDCDDYAILMGTLLLAVGGEVRYNKAYNDTAGHAFVEANLGVIKPKVVEEYLQKRYAQLDSSFRPHYRIDKYRNYWLNLDWTATHPGGNYFRSKRETRFLFPQGICEEKN